MTWSRKEAIASAPPFHTWPQAITSGLDPKRVEQYELFVEAMEMYFDSCAVKEITRITGVVSTRLPALARKCLTPASDGNILGLRALLPYSRFGDYTRTAADRPKFRQAQGGQAGLLGQLLSRFPDLEKELVVLIRKEANQKHIHEFKLRPCDLHSVFIKLIKEKNVGDNEWPFTTTYRGRRSIEKYMVNVLNRNFGRTVATREAQQAKAHLSVGTGYQSFLNCSEPYEFVEIDAYKIECHLTVAFETPEGTETDLLLERLWMIAVVDRCSTAILAYTVVYRSEVNADDVLAVIRQAATGKWAPMELTIPGLKYPPMAGLPNGILPDTYGAVWSAMLFDGALAHLSKAVHERARKALGCMINWGPVAHFERRPNVERTFNQIAKDLFKRLPSTTGSNPGKGRAPDAEGMAVRHKIRAKEVEQLLDVTVAQHNAKPSEGISSLTPLEVLTYFLDNPKRHFMIRKLPKAQFEHAKTFASREVAVVRGNKATGRRPYIQIDRAHYTSPVLANAGHLIGKQITIEIDDEDFRQVKAFLPNGAELGVLSAQGKWGITKHSRRTRKAINSLISKRIITLSEFDDPVQVYMRMIAQPRRGKNNDTLTSRQVTQLAGLAKESGKPARIPPSTPVTPQPQPKIAPVNKNFLETENSFFKKVKNRR